MRNLNSNNPIKLEFIRNGVKQQVKDLAKQLGLDIKCVPQSQDKLNKFMCIGEYSICEQHKAYKEFINKLKELDIYFN